MTKRCLLISLLALAFASSSSQTSAAGKGGSCPPLPSDGDFSMVKMLNDSSISNEFGRGVRGRLVTGLGPNYPNGALFVAATTNISVEAFLLTTDGSSIISHLTLGIPGADPSQYYTTLALGNIDGDNIPDVAVGSSMTQKVYVFTLQWDGSALKHNPISQPLQAPPFAQASGFGVSIAIGDLDGNGLDEVVVGAPGSNQVFVFQYDSENFTVQQTLTPEITAPLLTASAFGQSVAIGDVTGDEALDILVGAGGSDTTKKGNDIGAIFAFENAVNDSIPISFHQHTATLSNAVTGDEIGRGVASALVTSTTHPANVIAATSWGSSSIRAVVLPKESINGSITPDYNLYPLPGLTTGWATTGVDAGDTGGGAGNIILVGAPNASNCPSQASAGIVYTYLSGDSFTTHAIQSPNGPQKNWLAFGWSAAHIPETPFFVVGEPGREFNGVRKGQVYIFKVN